MRITIEPTNEANTQCDLETQHTRVVIECAGDDHTLWEVLDYIVTPALKAWGYSFDRLETYNHNESRD